MNIPADPNPTPPPVPHEVNNATVSIAPSAAQPATTPYPASTTISPGLPGGAVSTSTVNPSPGAGDYSAPGTSGTPGAIPPIGIGNAAQRANDASEIQADPNPQPVVAATSAPLSQIKSDNPAIQKLYDDSTATVSDALSALRDGVSKALDGVGSEIEPLTADLIPAAAAFIEAKTSPSFGNWVKSLVGISSDVVSPLETQLDSRFIAALAIFKADLDAVHI